MHWLSSTVPYCWRDKTELKCKTRDLLPISVLLFDFWIYTLPILFFGWRPFSALRQTLSAFQGADHGHNFQRYKSVTLESLLSSNKVRVHFSQWDTLHVIWSVAVVWSCIFFLPSLRGNLSLPSASLKLSLESRYDCFIGAESLLQQGSANVRRATRGLCP